MSTSTSGENDRPDIDAKLIPVMREAVLIVQMILYRRLEADIRQRRSELSEDEHRMLAGAAVNNLFSTQPEDEKIVRFGRENRGMVEEELRQLSGRVAQLVPFITDALRMKVICDNQEGIHSIPSLLIAKELGILKEERPLPLPSTFMLSTRNLAVSEGLVKPMKAAQASEAPQA